MPNDALLKKARRPLPTRDAKTERARLHETRVEYVADMMRLLTFRTGVTAKALALEWDLPFTYTAKIVLEASKRVRGEITDHDTVLSKVSTALDRVIDDALLVGDRGSIIKACQVWAQVSGAGAATRVQLQQDLTAMSPAELQARKEEIMSRLLGPSAEEPIEVTVLPRRNE